MNTLLYEFVKSSHSKLAYLLHGEWGSGKTYFLKEVFLPKINAKHKYYISLFGVSHIDEIYSQLITQRYLGKKSGKFLRISSKILSTVAKGVTNYLKDKTKLSTKDIDVGVSDIIPINDCVVVFDDLERISKTADVSELLGQINTYFISEESIRVIFVADEEKITDSVFAQYKEKIIGFQSTLEIDLRKTLISIAKTKDDKRFLSFLSNNMDFIFEMVESFEIRNLRTIGYYFDILKIVFTEKTDSLISKYDLLYSVFALAIEEKTNRLNAIRKDSDVPKYIARRKGSESISATSEDEELEAYFNRYLINVMRRAHNFSFNYYYYHSIFRVIRFGNLNKNEIQKEINQIEQYKEQKKQSKLMILVEKLRGYHFLTNEEFLTLYSEFIEEFEGSISDLSFDELLISSRLLFYLQGKPQLKIKAELLINKLIYPRLQKIVDEESVFYPNLIMSRLNREIGEISQYNSDLAKRFDEVLKKLNQRFLRVESMKKVESSNFKDLSEYDFRIFLASTPSSEIISIIDRFREEKGKLNEFTLKLERTLKAPIGSLDKVLRDNEYKKFKSLRDELVKYQKKLEYIENLWIEEMINALNGAINIHSSVNQSNNSVTGKDTS